MAGLQQLNWASEGVGATAAALVDLSTVAGNKISNPPWVKFQSAGWVNFPSAPTITVLMVEQNALEAIAIADSAYVLRQGRLVYQGSGASLDADLLKQLYLGGGAATPVTGVA
ncbi:hypothetical protein [Pseudomonas aeruginosa]|uniref:hypothetical protein n=1 Tax=Pseudomonas aeruginosa TaxID=287 RepID=UPI0012957E2A|nr:hypothetical protein [Pseudomonas aeruginosa]